MTTLQLALISGALMMIGPVLLIARYAPRHPALGAYLDSASGSATPHSLTATAATEPQVSDRIGYWLQRHIGQWVRIPRAELEILQTPVHKFLADKATFAVIGLALPPIMSVVLRLMGIAMPIGIPVIGSLALAAGLSFLPDVNVRSETKQALEEFVFVLGSYLDLVSLDRRAGTAPRQAMEQAAQVGDSWVFKRLAEELAHSRLSGIPPWERLKVLGDRYLVPELTELGHIMRIAGTENAGVYETLKQRSKAMRKAHLAKEITEANETSTKRSAPVALLGIVFTLLLAAPAILALMST